MDDDSSGISIFLILLFLLLDALITLAYTAFNNARQTQMSERAEAGNRRAQFVLNLTGNAPRLQTTYQLSLIVLRFGLAILATVHIALPMINNNPSIAPAVVYIVVLIVMAILTLILAGIVPESIASARPLPIALFMAYPMRWLMWLLNPVVVLLLAIGRVSTSVLGGDEIASAVTEEEIMTVVHAGHTGGAIEDEEKDMIYSVLQLDQTLSRELMTPRIDIKALDIETPVDEALAAFINSGFSRIPVYEETVDNISGLLYAKDLLNLWRTGNGEKDKSIRDLIRTAYFVPETKRADELLKEMKNLNVHMAIIVDEYGGTAGLVTIENLIEEIVGDIRDEYDLNEEAEYTEHGSGKYTVDAGMDLDDFNELLQVDLPTDDSDTLGGFILEKLGRVPTAGETIETPELDIRVGSVDGQRIRKVHITRKVQGEDSGDKSTVDSVATIGNETQEIES